MGRNIYFTEKEIHMLISYVEQATDMLGGGKETSKYVDEDLENGLGSALRKLYKGKEGECLYKRYKTKH